MRSSQVARYWMDTRNGGTWRCDLGTGLWEPVTPDRLDIMVTKDFLPRRRRVIDHKDLKSFLLELARETDRDPSMKGFKPGVGPIGHLAFRNGLLDLGSWEFRPIRATDGLVATTSYDYEEVEGDPTILLSTLHYITKGCQEAIDALMALMYITTAGVDVLPRRRLKHLIPVFVTVGNDGGRSTLFEFIGTLVGEECMPSMKWEELGDKVMLGQLIPAKAIRIGEIQTTVNGRSTAATNAKMLSGGDGVQARINYVGFVPVPQTVSMWVATNRDDVFCNVRDLANRVIAFVSEPIPKEARDEFDEKGYGRKILEPEECLKAISYFRRRFGDFETAARVVEAYATSARQKEVREQVLTSGDNVVSFVQDCLKVIPPAGVARLKKEEGKTDYSLTTLNIPLLYLGYRLYCQGQGLHPVRQKRFEEDFTKSTGVVPKKVKSPPDRQGRAVSASKCLVGVGLNDDISHYVPYDWMDGKNLWLSQEEG